MKIHSKSNLLISLLLIGWILYIWVSGDEQFSTVYILSFLSIVSYYAYSALSYKGAKEYLNSIQILKNNHNKAIGRLANIIYNAPVVLVFIASLIDRIYPSVRGVIIVVCIMALVIHWRITKAMKIARI